MATCYARRAFLPSYKEHASSTAEPLLRWKDSRHGNGLAAWREHSIVFALYLFILILPVVS